MPRGHKIFWIATTSAAIALAELLYFHSDSHELIDDAYTYYALSQRLIHGGLFAAAWPARTYGYPLFVAICSGFRTIGPETARALVFHAQLALLLFAAAAAVRLVGQIQRSDRVVRVTYAVIALNPFVLARATETLSDLLGGLCGWLAVLLVWRRDPPARSQSPPTAAMVSLFLASAAVMIRPAAVALLGAVAVLWLARQRIWREFRPAILPALVLVTALPFLPQVASNARAFGRANPLVVERIYRDQLAMGISRLKYATAVRPEEPPQIDYANPLARGERTPADFLRRPFAYLATMLLHLFALLDQDFLFTFVRDFHPWYRPALSAANFIFLFVGAVGAAAALARSQRSVPRDPRRFAARSLVFAAGASIAIYLPTAVESRFAVPFELLWSPFAAIAVEACIGWWVTKRWKLLAALGAGAIVGTICCLRISAWIIQQAPRLR